MSSILISDASIIGIWAVMLLDLKGEGKLPIPNESKTVLVGECNYLIGVCGDWLINW